MARGVPPVSAGLRCRCPQCGQGDLFSGYLTIKRACAACGANFETENAGDGPAFFVVVIVGILIVPLALGLQVAIAPPVWVQILIWLPAATALCLFLLRPFKAIMFALQWKYDASEAVFEDAEDKPKDTET